MKGENIANPHKPSLKVTNWNWHFLVITFLVMWASQFEFDFCTLYYEFIHTKPKSQLQIVFWDPIHLMCVSRFQLTNSFQDGQWRITYSAPLFTVCVFTGVTSQLFDDLGHESHIFSECTSPRLTTLTTWTALTSLTTLTTLNTWTSLDHLYDPPVWNN